MPDFKLTYFDFDGVTVTQSNSLLRYVGQLCGHR